jgi:ATPase family associated with various cellular activities (AAA)
MTTPSSPPVQSVQGPNLRVPIGSAAQHALLHRGAVIDRIVRRLGAEVPAWLATDLCDRHVAWEAELEAFDSEAGASLPLCRLDRRDARLLVGAGLIEDDIRFGALFAKLQDPLPARRPCLGLLSWLLADPDESSADLQERVQTLAKRGLLEIDNIDGPRSEWVLRLPVAIWDLLHCGRIVPASLPPTLTYRSAGSFPELTEVKLSGELAAAARRLPELLRTGGISAIVLRGMDGSGRLTLLGAAARALGQPVLVYDGRPGDAGWRLLAPLCELGEAFPVMRAALSPGESMQLPSMPGLERPLGLVLGRSGGLSGPMTERAVSFVFGQCIADDRRDLWATSASVSPEDAEQIAQSFLLTPGHIRRAGGLAQATALADGRAMVTAADVRTATRALQRQTLETLATRLDPLTGAPPVLSATAADELAILLARCRQRERLAAGDGAHSGTVNRGVRALFSGPSGTGKTLAARHLAARLNLDLYRVDLAAVVNKYIGETERNLDRVLARAEELDVLLLLDEGDALMTRRTEVSNANDRYANLETNFLLQRLETFDGIIVITTNAGSRIDAAFLRRIDVTIDFVPPDADQRWQLWHAHLPVNHEVDPGLVQDVARRCVLTGAQIRNATLHAMLLSFERDSPVSDHDVIAALQREYRRIGASFPLPHRNSTAPHW